jgi:4-hydroxybenzoate polyprenyltransferase
MLGVVTAGTAFGLGASGGRSAIAGLLGAFLSLGGFLLDDYLDRDSDRAAEAPRNPLASGRASPRVVLAVCVCSFAAAAVLALLLEPWVLVPEAAVAALLLAPSRGLAKGPVARAASLGTLQALYAAIGGLVAGNAGSSLLLLALFLFFAMTGGRVLGEVRDLPADAAARTRTIPSAFGMKTASVFLVANEILAYASGIAAAFAGDLGHGYLACMVAICVLGTGINAYFLADPTPRRADLANRASLGLLGGLYSLGMVLAGLARL